MADESGLKVCRECEWGNLSKTGKWFCNRYPPTAIVEGTMFPFVKELWTCGEFKRKGVER